jgi:hypothetical protein
MKSALFFLSFLVLFQSCSRKCDCSPPPRSDTNWKIINRRGGIAPIDVPLTDDEKNNVLTLKTNGAYSCKNTLTGTIISGTISMSNFSSIYGDRQQLIFSPKLPMLNEDYLILIENPNGRMVFGDNKYDGYFTTFEIAP